MRGIRLNTYWDSIEPAGVQKAPQPTFQSPDQTPGDGPEIHNSKPTRYPFKLKDGCRVAAGLQLPVLAVQEADVHLMSVQINSAVELGGGGVVFHGCSRFMVDGRPVDAG